MKLWKLTSITIALTLSVGVNAAIISTDWQSTGDNLITQDTNSGLEWLDLTATTSRAYSDISSKFDFGQEFEGWRYASVSEVRGYLDAFGGDSGYYYGWSMQNNGLFDLIAPYWGDTYCTSVGCEPGEGYSFAITGDAYLTDEYTTYMTLFEINDDATANVKAIDQDRIRSSSGYHPDFDNLLIGSALIRNISPVPVPAALWLFGSGLIGLVGFAKRKKA